MLTRRQFHLHLLASVAVLASPKVTFAASTPADLWLNRLTFGASVAERRRFDQLGALPWLEEQLSKPASDPALDARLSDARLRIAYEAGADENGHAWSALDELRPLSSLGSAPADRLYCIDWSRGFEFSERNRPANEVIAAALIRATHAPAQLRELITQFWHDHFNVNAQKDEFTAAFFPDYDAMLRENAFGNFRTLLGQVARSPAMLYYLNNADSRASPANENFARELLELHTLGAANYLNDLYDNWHMVPGAADGLAQGYLDLDVYEVARAFTGWSVGDGRETSDMETAPLTGGFHYIESWHDPYQKRFLAVEFPPNRAPMADGNQVLDILASHPATARLICTKLARRLLTDDPDPALVDTLAQTFLATSDSPDQIALVIRELVAHPSFAATPPGKLRRPFEFLVALYRASGAEITGTENNQQWQLARAGWRQHEYGPPTGHPDKSANWTAASSLNRLVDFALYAHEDWFGLASLDRSRVAAPDETVGAFLARWSALVGASVDVVIAAIDIDPTEQVSVYSDEDRASLANQAIAFGALTPEFMLR